MDIKYVGTRTDHGCEVVKEVDGVPAGRLDLRLDLWKHSAEFEWSYGGSGPAQLALALLADATEKDCLAVSLHQDFKFRFVGRLPRDGFEMTADEIEKWAAEAATKLDLSDWEEEDGG
jgi:hypothetical protein